MLPIGCHCLNPQNNDTGFSNDSADSSLDCSGYNSSFKRLEGDKEMIVAAILSLAVALYCYAITQLHQHGQLKWMDERKPHGFWGEYSNTRKYKNSGAGDDTPAFPLSTTLLVFLTDGYHLFQALFFSFLSLSFALAIGFNWWLFLGIFIGVRIVHWSARKILSK